MFFATNGPFQSPGVPGKFVSKFHNGAWWCAPSGSNDYGTVSATCPVCGGIKHLGRNAVQVPVNEFDNLAERMER